MHAAKDKNKDAKNENFLPLLRGVMIWIPGRYVGGMCPPAPLVVASRQEKLYNL
jgi:hypothetical protein